MTDHADTIRLTDAQSDWFVREVKRCREVGMPLGCCDVWPECSHVYEWMEPDCHEGNLGANIAGGRSVTDHADTIRRALKYTTVVDVGMKAETALEALLAERQQAIDERDLAIKRGEELVELNVRLAVERTDAEWKCEQAIDALRDLAIHDGINEPTYKYPYEKARAALVKLGEKP